MRQRIGMIFQGVDDEAAAIKWLNDAKIEVVGVINNPAFAKKLHDTVPSLRIIWHRYTEGGEAELWTNNKNYAELIQAFKNDGLHVYPKMYLYVMNEPVAHGKSLKIMCDSCVVGLNMCINAGVKTVFGNWGAAVYNKSEIDSGAFDGILRLAAERPDIVVLGFHEYGPPNLPMGAAGRTTDSKYHLDPAFCQPNYWPSPWDVQVSGRQNGSLESNYFIGRIYWWDERSNHIGVRPARKVITEAGQDRLDVSLIYDEIGKRYPPTAQVAGNLFTRIVAWVHSKLRPRKTQADLMLEVYSELARRHDAISPQFITIRGFQTLKNYYNAVFPQWGFARTVVEMLRWLSWVYDDTIYRKYRADQTEPTIEGVNLFVWTYKDKQDWSLWYGFNYALEPEVLEWFVKWAEGFFDTAPPSGDPPTLPTPGDVIISEANAHKVVTLLSVAEDTINELTTTIFGVE